MWVSLGAEGLPLLVGEDYDQLRALVGGIGYSGRARLFEAGLGVIVHLDIDAEAACASVGQRATGVERQAGPFRFPTPQAIKL